jgi:hypothetical protein
VSVAGSATKPTSAKSRAKRPAAAIASRDQFCLAVLNDPQLRGAKVVLSRCVDGLAGVLEAIDAVFPEAWARPASSTQLAPAGALQPDLGGAVSHAPDGLGAGGIERVLDRSGRPCA